jgi:uncharacterized membrane protein YkvA (DUF1232 family)
MSTFPLESLYNWYRNLVSNPKYRWWVIAGTLVYLLSPFDIAPDFIPFIGQIDDAIVVTLLVTELAQVLRDRSGKVKANKTKVEDEVPVSIDIEAVETQ